ncbi:hypothetical protein E3A20_14860 [Planctomyces bekefii]|uniref:UspA domain-containing protein n=1 Tax=Planctomyces bekefii TaxID=1653850 RepID=A0A5C6M8M2_9PLAN|nr:hypothetical protein E3A20_14860 [Planctomyces bekefii]
MSQLLPSLKGRVVIALAFDENSKILTDSAAALAAKFGVAIRFVHVIEPEYDASVDFYGAGVFTMPLLAREARDRQMAAARGKMKELVGSLKLNVPVDGKVLEGPVAETIAAEAISANANFIVCAARPRDYKFLPGGFSVALTLMHHAPMPVLVLADQAIDLNKQRFNILLADDLRDASIGAVRRSYELAAKLPGSRVRHLHVHGDFRELMREKWQDLSDTIPALKTNAQSPDGIWAEDHAARLKAMRDRGAAELLAAEARKVPVEIDIRTGNVPEELHATAVDFQPDLLVFGRHKFFKTRPYLIGRMSFRSMFMERRPVLIVPPPSEVYAPMPFPAE